MNILLTGARGQLGRELVPVLEAAGHVVRPAGSAELDLSRPGAFARALADQQHDCVVNCAAYTAVDQAETDPAGAFAVNRDAVAELGRAAAALGAHVVHVSTDYVFDGRGCRPYEEAHPTAPASVYGRSKAEGEAALGASGAEAVIVRTAWLYGAQGNNFVKTMLGLAASRERLTVVDDQLGTPTWARDLARVVARLVERRATGVYHYTNEGVASWYDFALAIVEEARARGARLAVRRVDPVPTESFPRPAPRPAYGVLSKRKVREWLGVPIPHWRESLRRMLEETPLP